MVWLQFLLLPLFLLLIYKSFIKITNDHITASLITFAFPFYFIAEFFSWAMPIFDVYGYFLLALLFVVNNKFLRYIILVAVCFCDERALISSSIVYIALMLLDYKEISLKRIFSFNQHTIVFILGWTTYFIIRFILIKFCGVIVPASTSINVGLFFLLNNYKIASLGMFLLYEGFWVAIVLAFISVLFKKRWQEAIIVFGSLIFFMILNLIVFDVTRSLGYCYVFIFVAALIINRHEDVYMQRNIATLTLICCISIPTMYIYNQPDSLSVIWLSPMFPKILHFIF